MREAHFETREAGSHATRQLKMRRGTRCYNAAMEATTDSLIMCSLISLSNGMP